MFGSVTRLMTDTITDHSLNHVQFLTIYSKSVLIYVLTTVLDMSHST